MLKTTARNVLKLLAASLPWGGRRAVLDATLESFGRLDVLCELAVEQRIEGLLVRGDFGLIAGPPADQAAFRHFVEDRRWASTTVKLFQDLFSESGGTYLDIGANLGLTLIPIARNDNVQCRGYEPEPLNFAFLVQNVNLNCQHGNVSLNQIALFDRNVELPLGLSPTNFGDHRIVAETRLDPEEKFQRGIVQVPAHPLDDVLAPSEIKLPLGVKIDTQGAEPRIFAGGKRVLGAASAIALEFWPRGMSMIGGDVEGMIDFLGAHFREGAIAIGDSDTPHEWRPIQDLLDELRRHWRDPDIGNRYFDVTVRK